jgi:hypothetical protein
MSPGPIDRDKHDVDVLEHVIMGVHTELSEAGGPGPVEGRQSQGSHVGVHAWLGGTVFSAVQVQVLPDDETDERSPI